MDAYLNSVPVIPTVLIVMNGAGFVPAFFLLHVAKKAPLHDNCRFLLVGWVCGLFSVFSVAITIAALNIFNADGYIATDIMQPPLRHKMYGSLASASVFCSCFELSIAFERIISSICPQKYHRSLFSKWPLLLLTCVNISLAFIEFSVQNAGYHAACGFIMQSMDVSTIIVNSIAVRYCKRRHLNLNGWLSLNARYQIKEAYDMSRAMQPVLATVLFFKCIIILSTDFAIYFSLFGDHSIGYNEGVYLFVTALYGNCVTIMLMRAHPALRKQAVKILCKPIAGPSMQIQPESETDSHFEFLNNEWRLN